MSQSTATASTGRIRALDLLRCLAVLLVIGTHCVFLPQHDIPLLTWLMKYVYRAGWVGVDLFFVLSGFLVSGLLFREWIARGRIDAGRFLIRRGLKIYPGFWFLVLASVVWMRFTDMPFGRAQVASELLFIQNYRLGLFGHTWSLAVEEHFYLLLVLLIVLLVALFRRRHRQDPFAALMPLTLVVGLGLLALRTWHAWRFPYTTRPHLTATHFRLDSLLFGVLLSYFYHFHRPRIENIMRRGRWLLLPAAVVLLVPSLLYGQEIFVMHTIGFTFLYLAFGIILLAALVMPRWLALLPLPVLAAATLVGENSYSIYLWHVPVVRGFERLALPFPLALPLVFVASVAVGWVTARLVEFPCLALRDRWFPSRNLSQPAPAAPESRAGSAS